MFSEPNFVQAFASTIDII